ncbi:1506_t:CDS:2 [Racocetra fulgida]|uniref:1506_t:CDS:1 n=1 Tax=Racocetra fulgida TaxID=60492 RepID=A0A9N9BF99_9GLOM|nr:1506_t:CDS:2 [Racocetra fulgida]
MADATFPPPDPSANPAEATLKVKGTKKGVKSSDPSINRDAKSLRQFFDAYNSPPNLQMHIKEKTQEKSGKDGHKNIYTIVTDFEVTLDLNGYIVPTPQVVAEPSYDEYLEAYIRDENKCKEITLKKVNIA